MSSRKPPLPDLGRSPLVAAVLSDEKNLLADARRAVRDGAGLLEIRADHFSKGALKPNALVQILGRLRQKVKRPLLLTLRCRAEGGKFPRGLSEQDQIGRASCRER